MEPKHEKSGEEGGFDIFDDAEALDSPTPIEHGTLPILSPEGMQEHYNRLNAENEARNQAAKRAREHLLGKTATKP